MKQALKRNWNYIVIALIPWLLLIAHTITRGSFLNHDGGILAGKNSTVYYEVLVELWNKVHGGGSIMYTWNTGLGVDFLTLVFRYLISPFTLIYLLVPKQYLELALQIGIMMKWSIAACTTLYFVKNTVMNRIEQRKTLMDFVLTVCIVCSNVVLTGLSVAELGDLFILLPLVLLWLEKVLQGSCKKRFFVALILMYAGSVQSVLLVSILLVVWLLLCNIGEEKYEKRNVAFALMTMFFAVVTVAVVYIPVISNLLFEKVSFDSEYVVSSNMDFWAFVQRLYFGDSLLTTEKHQPMLYFSRTILAVGLLYWATPENIKRKLISTLLLVFTCVTLASDSLYNTLIGVNRVINNKEELGYIFVLFFVYMTMQVVADLEKIKIWHVLIALVLGCVLFGWTFFSVTVFRDFYVYLFSFLLFFFILLLLVFFCRKSIMYKNILIVISILTIGELLANGYLQLGNNYMYKVSESFCNSNMEVLANMTEFNGGERIATPQCTNNYGMVVDVPTANGELDYHNGRIMNLYKSLGFAVSSEQFSYMGASPMMNLLFNVKNVVAENELAASDMMEVGKNGESILYQASSDGEMAYVLPDSVLNCDIEKDSPFDIQNDIACAIVPDATIFDVCPVGEFKVDSLLGGHELKEHHIHSAEEEEEIASEEIVVYNEALKNYDYPFEKMYSEDVVKASFDADGTTDYYMFIKSTVPCYYTVLLDDQKVYEDQIPSNQTTFHIGKQKEGTKVQVAAWAILDNDDYTMHTINYQFAAFNEEAYQKVSEKLQSTVWTMKEFGLKEIVGSVEAAEDGVLFTSVPYSEGWKVTVDGQNVAKEVCLDSFVAVPIGEGTHDVLLAYETPKVKTGLVVSLVGILGWISMIFVGNQKKKKQVEA